MWTNTDLLSKDATGLYEFSLNENMFEVLYSSVAQSMFSRCTWNKRGSERKSKEKIRKRLASTGRAGWITTVHARTLRWAWVMKRPGLFPPPAASQVPCSSEHHSDELRADPRAISSTSSFSGSLQLWTSQCMVTLMFKVLFPCSTDCKWQPTACGVQAEQQPALRVGEERGSWASRVDFLSERFPWAVSTLPDPCALLFYNLKPRYDASSPRYFRNIQRIKPECEHYQVQVCSTLLFYFNEWLMI